MLRNSTQVFSEYFIEGTANALESSCYKDVTIILGDEPTKPAYHLHKMMLAATCTFFRKLFLHDPRNVYNIGNVSKTSFDNIIGYIYRQELTLSTQDYWDHLRTVSYIGCEDLYLSENERIWLLGLGITDL